MKCAMSALNNNVTVEKECFAGCQVEEEVEVMTEEIVATMGRGSGRTSGKSQNNNSNNNETEKVEFAPHCKKSTRHNT